MNILLVYPQYPDTFWSFKHVLKFISKKAAFPPLGLLTIASMLPKEWNMKLVDANVKEITDQELEWADMVFISAMTVQKKNAQEIISRCKTKGKKVVAGGPLFTLMHENFKDVDHFVLNEGEITLPQFLKDLGEGCLKHMYTSTERPDITKTPIPKWDLINPKDYSAMAIQYSRGCPFNCEFCDIVIMNGRIPRTKTPEQVIKEFQTLYDNGWRGTVFVVDDNFIGNKLKAKELLPHVIKWQEQHKYPFLFLTEASTNLADDEELMDLMAKANFSRVFLGIETPSEESLVEAGKMQNTSRNLLETVKTIQQHGMQVMGGFIVGFDHDTESIFQSQINFIQKAGCVIAMVGLLTAVPQTRLWNRLKAENRLLTEFTGDNTEAKINFIPKMDTEKLLDGYRNVLSTIYSPKEYYERITTFIQNYNPKAKTRIKMQEIKAFLMSMWKIGIFSSARKYYWKLLTSTLFKKTKAFPVAVELAILGIHFQKIAEKSLST